MHALHTCHGWSIARIAREFDVNWRTARRYARSEGAVRYAERARPAELSEAQLAHVKRRLAACPQLRATTLYRELSELGYAGSYPSLARRVRLLRPRDERADPVVRFETDPGVQTQVDWAEAGRWPLADSTAELHCLVAVLGYSRMVALRFATEKTRATTLALLPDLLLDLGGAGEEVLSDRDPAFVIGETPRHRPVFAPEWLDLAANLGTRPRACRAHRAKTKGKVERVVREVKEDFLRWLTGQLLPVRPTLDDYDALARHWATTVVASRRHRTTQRIVGEAWEEERPVLREIPARLPPQRTGENTDLAAGLLDLAALHGAGETVEAPSLAIYEAVLS
jgi:transposase